jgi:hypothetical protein
MRGWGWFVWFWVAGCGHEQGTHDGLGEVCEELAAACHDATSDDAFACHEVGHEGDESACEAELEACVDLCEG